MMKSRISILFVFSAVTACGVASSGDDGASADDDDSSASAQPVSVGDGAFSAAAAIAECSAQRAVYLVGGNGGLASFTLAWPLPAVIQHFAPQYAYDQPAKALSVGGSIATNLDDLAAKLAAIRAEVEAMAQAGRNVSPEELDAAMARVRTASAAFRAALETAEADAS